MSLRRFSHITMAPCVRILISPRAVQFVQIMPSPLSVVKDRLRKIIDFIVFHNLKDHNFLLHES